ncbi:MAG: hypothetical protein DVB22_003183, partial [Verrucomicrobia bacterium]
MMGPLNEPLDVGIVNPFSQAREVTLGGLGFTAFPGMQDVQLGGTSAAHAPQPGVKLDFEGEGTGVLRKNCPPGAVITPGSVPQYTGPLEFASPSTEQYVGQARVTDNLDSVGTSREPRVHGAGGISPGQMGRTGGLPQIEPPRIHYSANIGAFTNGATVSRGSSGILRTIHGSLLGPHRRAAYEVVGSAAPITNPSSIVAPGGEVTELYEQSTASLLITFRTSASETVPHKAILITKLEPADVPLGYDEAWDFTVSYPGDEATTTRCAIDIPSAPSGEYRTSVKKGEVEREWTSKLEDGIRQMIYRERVNGVLVSHTIDEYATALWDVAEEMLVSSTLVTTTTGAGLTTLYRYWWDQSDPDNPNNERLQQVVYPDGSWEMSAVSGDGLRSVVLRPWLSNSAPPVLASDPTPAAADNLIARLLQIEGSGPNFEAVETTFASATLSNPNLVDTVLTRRAGVLVAKEVRAGLNIQVYDGATLAGSRVRSDGRWYSDGNSGARRIAWTGLGSAAPSQIGFVDRVEVLSSVASGVRTTTEHRQAYGAGDPTAGAQAPVFSTVTTSSPASGNTLTEVSKLDGITYEVVEYQYEASASGRYTGKLVNGVPVETVSYLFVQPAPPVSGPPLPQVRSETRTSSDGTFTTTTFDSYDRPVLQRVAGTAAGSVFGVALPEQPASVTTWTYEARAGGLPGWIVTTSVKHEPVSSTLARVTVEEYDGAGRLVFRRLPDSSERFYEYGMTNGERFERIYAGASASETTLLSETVYFRDQRRKSVSGAAEIVSLWQYSVPAPFRTKVVHLQSGQLVSEVTTDAFGRPVTAYAPVSPTQSGGATFFTSSFTYDPAHGGLVSRTVPSASEVTRTTWSTDPAGGAKKVEIISGVSAAPNPVLNEATDQSLRRVVKWTEVDTSAGYLAVGNESVALVWECEAVFHAAQAGGWETTPASTRRRAISDRPKGGFAWNGHAAGAAPVSWLNDGGTDYTTARSIAGVPGEEPLSSETVTRRSGAMFRRVVARGGLDMAFSSPDAANVLLPYNGWREALAEPSWDTIPHWPRLAISPSTGQVTSRQLPGGSIPTTVYTYYTVGSGGLTSSDIRIGRLRSEAAWDYLTDSTRGTTYFHYDAAGRVTASWGSATATTLYSYDVWGRRTGLKTFRSEPSAFAGLVPDNFGNVEAKIGSCWLNGGIGDLTQWVYSTNPALGAVVSKMFPDGTSTDYSYNAAGQVQTRTWARTVSPTGPKVTTTYSWNFAGQLTGIGYNDGTPNVAFSYDRSGRVRYRTDGTGVTRMDYRFDGSPMTETTVDSASDTAVLVAGGRHLSRAYDSSGRLWKMEAAWGQTLPGTASTAGSSTLSPQVVFSYGAADRLVSIYSGGFTGAVTRTATQESFSVSPNTGLYYPPSVYSTVYRDAQGLPSSHAAGGTINVAGSPSPFSISTTQFGWNGDRLVSRTEAPDAKWNYTYDSKGQVRDAWKTVQNGGSAVTLNGTQSRYSYDDMGNRTSLGEGPGFARMTTWTPNNLNQYTSVARQRTFDVTGRRSPGASIAVNSPFNANGVSYQPTSNGLYYHIELTNSPTPGTNPTQEELADTMEPVSVTQTLTPGATPTVISPPGALQWLGLPNETPVYDADGNLRFDGRWTMTWDGENRLVKLERPAWTQPTSTTEGYSFTAPANPQGIPPNALPAATIEFKYDGLSRLVERKVTRGIDPPEVEGYQWDGWKLIM